MYYDLQSDSMPVSIVINFQSPAKQGVGWRVTNWVYPLALSKWTDEGRLFCVNSRNCSTFYTPSNKLGSEFRPRESEVKTERTRCLIVPQTLAQLGLSVTAIFLLRPNVNETTP